MPVGASAGGVERAEESTAPGAASAARAGVRVSFAGRSAVFRRRRCRPALLRSAPRCSCLAVACGDRGVSSSTWPTASCSAPMASRLRCLVTVYGPGCLPGHRDYLKHHDSLGFDAGRLLCPLVPRGRSRGLARPPSAVSGCPPRPQSGAWRIRFDPPRRPSTERRGASVPTRVHLPPQLRHTRVSRHCALAPRRRHPQAMAPRLRRISTGRLVSQSVGMAPDHAATGRLPHGRYDSASTKAAPEKSSYHPCRCRAPGRLSAPSLPDSHHRADMPRKALRPLPGAAAVVTGLAPRTAHRTNTAMARIIVSLARITSMSAGRGPPPASRPPPRGATRPRCLPRAFPERMPSAATPASLGAAVWKHNWPGSNPSHPNTEPSSRRASAIDGVPGPARPPGRGGWLRAPRRGVVRTRRRERGVWPQAGRRMDVPGRGRPRRSRPPA